MAQRDIVYESNSNREISEPIESFRSVDRPINSNPSPYDSEVSSSSDSEYTESPSTPSTPTTPASPATSLGASFSYVGLSSPTSEDQLFSTPKPKKKRVVKRSNYNFKNGFAPFYLRSTKSPGRERAKVVRPFGSLYDNIRFANETRVCNIKLSEYSQNLIPATSNRILNQGILNHVFSLLSCVDKTCKGKKGNS